MGHWAEAIDLQNGDANLGLGFKISNVLFIPELQV